MLCRLVLIVLLLAGTASAEPVRIRSGEHDSFSRIVLTFPAGTPWRLGRTAAGYGLVLQGQRDYDLSQVFERIPRDRLAAVTQSQGQDRLELALDCECHATAFLWQPDQLVVDIVDGTAPAGSPFEAPLDQGPRAEPPRLDRLPLFSDPGQTNVAVATMPLTRNASPPHSADSGNPPPQAEGLDPPPRTTEMETALIESIARAATQGLLEADIAAMPAMDEPEDPPVTVEEPAPPDLAAPLLPEAELTSDRPGITARTSLDRDFASVIAALEGEVDPCLADENFAVADWVATADFAAEIGTRQAALSSELDTWREGAIVDLARAHVHFGFGQEALAVLSLDGADSSERRIIAALARIVDGMPSGPQVLTGQQGCTRPVALWTALERGDLSDTTEAERTAAMLAYRALPQPLQAQLAGRVAELFLHGGDAATAAEIISGAAHEPAADIIETALTGAEVDLATSGSTAAIATLTDLAEEDARLTPEGLLRLLDLSITEGAVVDPAQIELARAMRYEARGSDMAIRLWEAESRILLAANQFDAVLALLEEEADGIPADLLSQTSDAMVTDAAARMDDAAFAEFAFGAMPSSTGIVAGNAAAARLIALGFPERARELLTDPAEGPPMAERRYLRAEAALALGRTTAAISELDGMSDARATALRIAALEAEGRYAEAEAALTGTAPEDPALSWRAGDWAGLDAATDPLLAAAAAAMTDTTELPADAQPLAGRQALLTQAEETRTLARELLTRFSEAALINPVPVAP